MKTLDEADLFLRLQFRGDDDGLVSAYTPVGRDSKMLLNRWRRF